MARRAPRSRDLPTICRRFKQNARIHGGRLRQSAEMQRYCDITGFCAVEMSLEGFR